MRRELVVRRKWLPENEFLRMFAACNLIPGPSSTELAIYLGYRRAGWRGLVAGGVSFILPAMLIMLFIAWAYQRYGTSSQALGILYGIRAAVVGIVLWAIIDLGRRLVKRWTLVILAAAMAGLFLIGINPVLLIVASGLIAAAASQVQPKPRVGMLTLPTGLALPAWSTGKLLTVFLTFLKLGVVSFGSGYVLYAFLHADFVQGLHWLTDKQLIDAIAIGQATPGPVFTTATLLGYLFAGVPGALLASLVIFLPGFVLVPFLDRLVALVETQPLVRNGLSSVNAAVIGLIVGVGLQLARASIDNWLTVAIAILAFLIVLSKPLAAPIAVLGGAAAGLATLAVH